MFDYRIETRLAALAVPTLVVRGARDPIAPQRWCEEAAALLPAGRLAVVPGAPHAVNYAAPEALAALTLALAAELAAGDAAAGS
jgi:pimeloyl-ACP methyl ester carboxylesterase